MVFFPENIKLANVPSVWKQKGVKSSKLFYRPISLLPTLSKCLESIIHKRLLLHFIDNNIISDWQAAYLKGDSVTHQLLYIVHKIRLACQQGKIAQAVFCYVEGDFEKVWHAGLLAKLEQASVTGKCFDLFQSYLSNRMQVTVVDNVKSDVKQVTF